MSEGELRFIFQGDIRPVLDHFSRLLGVRFCFLSPDGTELQVGEGKPHLRFCRLIRHRMKLSEKCFACDRQGWKKATGSGKAVWYRCHAGMIDGCMAVRSGERIIGYMMIGQFRSRDTCTPALRRRWRKDHGNDDLQTAFLEAPFYPRNRIRDIMGVFSVLVNFIVSHRLVDVGGPNPIRPLLSYMEEHPEQTLTVGEAARLLHRSESSLSHIFKKTFNKSFLQYQIDRKLDTADELFRSEEGITVREAAFRLGFSDPYYFSRLYRKHRGYPPREAIRRNRPEPAEG